MIRRMVNIMGKEEERLLELTSEGYTLARIVRAGINACHRELKILEEMNMQHKPLGVQAYLYGSSQAGWELDTEPRAHARSHLPVWIREMNLIRANMSLVSYTTKWRGKWKQVAVYNSKIAKSIKEKFYEPK